MVLALLSVLLGYLAGLCLVSVETPLRVMRQAFSRLQRGPSEAEYCSWRPRWSVCWRLHHGRQLLGPADHEPVRS